MTHLSSTSTGAPVVIVLAEARPGDRKVISVKSVASSSDAPFHINTSSTADVTFDGTNVQMVLSTNGASAVVYAETSGRWLIEAINAATFGDSS